MKEDSKSDEILDQYTKNKVEKGIKSLRNEKKLKIKWTKELAENEAAQKYLQGFNPSSTASFVTQYLNQKYSAYIYSDLIAAKTEKERSKYINEAHDLLKSILQKNLFDLQCQWRAEEIELEGVEICFDFKIWEHDILNCPFLAPITKDEITMLQNYLIGENPDHEDLDHYGSWQDYEEYKEAYTADPGLRVGPDWYDYHNSRTGNYSMFLLPDLRGKKEEFYIRKEVDRQIAEQATKEPGPPHIVDPRPYMKSYDRVNLEFFVNNFEDAESKKRYNNMNIETEISNEEEYEQLWWNLLEVKEPIPIEENDDVFLALEIAYNKFYLKKLVENLPIAHEQYLFNKEMNLTVGEKDHDYKMLRDLYYTRILKGRVLNGEAADLNF